MSKRYAAQSARQAMFQQSRADVTIYGGSAFGGKRLCIDTPVPTPSGWTTMGDLREGDIVFGRDGKPCTVVAAYPIEMAYDCFRLVLDGGEEIDADVDHLWVTSNLNERVRRAKCNDVMRATRRASRPKRGKGVKPWLAIRNSLTAQPQNLPYESVRTTGEIVSTLFTSRGRVNHFIDLHGGLDLPDIELPLDPYTLGVWLGDGTSVAGHITSADPEILRYCALPTKSVRASKSKAHTYTLTGLMKAIRDMGLYANKHVPSEYLRAGTEQRTALLQGLMDTDGTVDKEGSASFTTTSPALRDGFLELARSLGIKLCASEGRAKLYGKDCGPVWDIHFSSLFCPFKLKRKADRWVARARRGENTIVGAESIAPKLMRCIAVDSVDHTYLVGRHMIPTHNTTMLQLEGLKLARRYKGFRGVILRRTLSDIRKSGSLFDSTVNIYQPTGCRIRSSPIDFSWEDMGSKIELAGLEHENDKYKYQGGQLGWIGLDELTHFTETQFHYLRTRVDRGLYVDENGRILHGYMSATCNPHKGWVRDLIGWWLLPNWFPDESKAGVIRFMCRSKDDKLVGFESYEAARKYLNDIDDPEQEPWTLTFIPAKASDNPIGMKENPKYVKSLSSQDRVTRKQLLDGNWDAAQVGEYFDRTWLMRWDGPIPESEIKLRVRGWDYAYSEGKGDWTSGTMLVLLKNGKIIIQDSIRFQLESSRLINRIASIAKTDGHRVVQAIFQDPAAGKLVSHVVRDAIQKESPGTKVDIIPATKSKGDYFSLFSSAIDPETKPIDPDTKERQKVCYYCDGNWVPEYLSELEAWTGVEVKGELNDQVDSTARAWTYIQQNGFRPGLSGWATSNR